MLSAWVILSFNSIFGALTCHYRCIGSAKECMELGWRGLQPGLGQLFPYAIYWPVRVVWEMSLERVPVDPGAAATLRMADEPPRTATGSASALLWG